MIEEYKKPHTWKDWLKSIAFSLGAIIVILIFGSPFFYIGEYKSDQKYKDKVANLESALNRQTNLVAYQSSEYERRVREVRVEVMEEKRNDLDRIMLICNAAAMESKQSATKSAQSSEKAVQAIESAKGVLETVKEKNDAQVDVIRETLEKVKK